MVTIFLHCKSEIQKQLNILIDQCVNRDLDEACNTADNLDKAIVKYFVSRNLKYDEIREILKDMVWTFDHFPCHEWRKEKFFEQLAEFYKALQKDNPLKYPCLLDQNVPYLPIFFLESNIKADSFLLNIHKNMLFHLKFQLA